jgi:hypothetical protein
VSEFVAKWNDESLDDYFWSLFLHGIDVDMSNLDSSVTSRLRRPDAFWQIHLDEHSSGKYDELLDLVKFLRNAGILERLDIVKCVKQLYNKVDIDVSRILSIFAQRPYVDQLADKISFNFDPPEEKTIHLNWPTASKQQDVLIQFQPIIAGIAKTRNPWQEKTFSIPTDAVFQFHPRFNTYYSLLTGDQLRTIQR